MQQAWHSCLKCGEKYGIQSRIYACSKCGGLLEIGYDYGDLRNEIDRQRLKDRTTRSMWRYKELMPIASDTIVTLGEGFTPLVKTKRLGEHVGTSSLYLKLDFTCPTGSFKDRGSSLLVSKAKEVGADTVAIDSSGNAASSLSAYSARAGLESYIFMPSYASEGKIIQTSATHSHVIKVAGTRKDTYETARSIIEKRGWYYCSFQVNPFASEGSKTIGYEICEQFDWEPLEMISFPVGTGSGLLGCWRGLKDLEALGFVRSTPSLICTQAAGCSPIATAFKKGSKEIQPFERAETIAEGLMISQPLKGTQVLSALKESKGFAESVTEGEIMEACRLLGKLEGVFVEPSAAVSVAGVMKLLQAGTIDRNSSVVCVLTGSGLKTLESYRDVFGKPTTLEPGHDLPAEL